MKTAAGRTPIAEPKPTELFDRFRIKTLERVRREHAPKKKEGSKRRKKPQPRKRTRSLGFATYLGEVKAEQFGGERGKTVPAYLLDRKRRVIFGHQCQATPAPKAPPAPKAFSLAPRQSSQMYKPNGSVHHIEREFFWRNFSMPAIIPVELCACVLDGRRHVAARFVHKRAPKGSRNLEPDYRFLLPSEATAFAPYYPR